ncbi:MAG: VPLPA-CTERM sorting domain-containing protein [Pseudomonadota bacterium]
MKKFLVSAALVALSTPAFAATVSVTSFSKSSYEAAVGSITQSVIQDFEGSDIGNVDDGFSTNVGTFASLGGTGSGGTVSDAPFSNNGNKLALRKGDVFGRVSTTSALTGVASDDMFLDSNDTFGIVWNVKLVGSKMFDRLVFTITDAAEFGNALHITTIFGTTIIDSAGGSIKRLVDIDLGQEVSSAVITLGHFSGDAPVKNDGFSIDDIAVSEVPLPASALFLLGGLGGLALMRRRKS